MSNPQRQWTPAHAPNQAQEAGAEGMTQSSVSSGNSAQSIRESSQQADQPQGFLEQTAGQVMDMAHGAGKRVMNVAQGAGETVMNVAQGTGQTVMSAAHGARETVKKSLGADDKGN
ncbi:uncharacterized protein LOC100264920 isoform X1 [Vitis vinifera]|uniref:Late embryogenesis abundant protein 1 n=1 Tax=Vitis vinifera TaxID=29760 RepID=A0A438IJ82_VITVI|nr:uncharacterized protein LOC100264920 isoform X1 [Vitis vinifera]RVW96774.1 hypothetical protein CK203_026037 [Vitis vinifera]|eukprot:XP_019073065.1 PREDICTED: uncharacterized protein LOC100264920 isoform X1 [Vitis vinifera]